MEKLQVYIYSYHSLGTGRVTCSNWFIYHCSRISPTWTKSFVGKVYIYQV